jgi:IS30 family transposase
MNQTTKYRQLQPEDRMTLASMGQQGSSARAMARALVRSPSTITRELARNTQMAMPYGSHTAQVASFSRRVAARPAT